MRSQQVIEKLRSLRQYALEQSEAVEIQWDAEDSHMVRYANSAVSLNSHEDITRLRVTVYGDHRQASSSQVVDFEDRKSVV